MSVPADAEPEAGGEAGQAAPSGEAVSESGGASDGSEPEGSTAPKGFRPAPHIPAPLRAARPSKRFAPEAGMIIPRDAKRRRFGRRKKPKVEAEEDERFDEDLTPSWVYRTILAVCIVGFVWAYLFWNSDSAIIGPVWKLAFLIEMAFFAIIGLVVFVRLGRQKSYGKRFAAFLGRRRDGFVRFVVGIGRGIGNMAKGVARTGQNLREGGTSFAEGFQSGKEPNFIVKTIRGTFRLFVRIIFGIIRLIVGIFKLVLGIYVLAVRIFWMLWRGIVEPVFFLALRIVRWALKITYRVFRWTLRLAWRIFYWIVRRWPIKYVTNLLVDPVGDWAIPKVTATNMVVSEALGAPVRPEVQETALPYVTEWRLHTDAGRAAKVMEKMEHRETERPVWATIPTPEERKARRDEKIRIKKQEEAAAKQAELDAKEAEKEAKRREKEEKKAQKEAEKGMSKEERAEMRAKAKAEAAEAKAKKREKDKKDKDAAEKDADAADKPLLGADDGDTKDKKPKKEKPDKPKKPSRAERKRQKAQEELAKKAAEARRKKKLKEMSRKERKEFLKKEKEDAKAEEIAAKEAEQKAKEEAKAAKQAEREAKKKQREEKKAERDKAKAEKKADKEAEKEAAEAQGDDK